MTTSLVALCADTMSLQHPEALGLAGENLATQGWLRLFSSAEEARRFLRADRLVDEVWVASSDDVAPMVVTPLLRPPPRASSRPLSPVGLGRSSSASE